MISGDGKGEGGPADLSHALCSPENRVEVGEADVGGDSESVDCLRCEADEDG